MKQITLTISGMSCGHCVNAIERVLKALTGVQSVVVSLESKNAQIGFDPDKITPEQMIQAITEEGYSAST